MENQFANSDIAEIIELTGKLMDLHDVDLNRAKLYSNSGFTLERLNKQLKVMTDEEIKAIRLYGPVLLAPIREILETGTLKSLEELIAKTPEGIFDVMKVRGLGVKKVKTLWQEAEIDSLEALKLAAENGEIAKIKGFGKKSQETILESVLYLESLKGKLRLDAGLALSHVILEDLKKIHPTAEISGEMLRIENEATELSFLVVKDGFGGIKLPEDSFEQDMQASSPSTWRGHYGDQDIKVTIEKSSTRDLISKRIIKSAADGHLTFENENSETFLSFLSKNSFETEKEAYEKFGYSYIIPEMRNGFSEFEKSKNLDVNKIITWEDIRGTVHNHSTYSDGKNTVLEMAEACKNLGFEYFGIADHSQTAAYAGGLFPETVLKQQEEIDQLNDSFTDGFRILKGIESDILQDGSLDYPEEILQSFDYIVASVHSVLNMDVQTATERLIKAVENKYTSILGHPTGRIILRREGYPVDMRKVIDACAANGVIMELNASPYRLDIDWRWIDYCMEKDVMISINPDAHNIEGLEDIHYGVMIARKAGLPAEMTLNTLSLDEIIEKFKK